MRSSILPAIVCQVMRRRHFILGCFILALLTFDGAAESTIRLRDRIELTPLKKLTRSLIEIESVGLKEGSNAEKETYRRVTQPLLEYLNDTVLAGDEDVVLYPKAIAVVIADEVKKQTSMSKLAAKLIIMYEKDEYAKLATAIAVIVHPTNDQEIDKRFLKRVWERAELRWRNGKSILPLDLPDADPLRRAFSKAILHKTPQQMQEHYVEVKIKARAKPPQPLVQKSVEAVLALVEENAGVIGYAPLVDAKLDGASKIAFILDE